MAKKISIAKRKKLIAGVKKLLKENGLENLKFHKLTFTANDDDWFDCDAPIECPKGTTKVQHLLDNNLLKCDCE